MSADHDNLLSRAWCYCAHCMGPGEGASDAEGRTYYVPDPPKIPLPPGAAQPVEEPGYRGPRYHTLLRGDDWNDPQLGLPVLVPYAFATRAMSNYAQGNSVGKDGFEFTSGEPLDATQRASIRQALDLWEQVSGLFFIEVPDSAAWDFPGIRFLLEGLDVYGLLGVSLPHDEPYGFNIVFNRVTYADDPLVRGTDAFYTAMHEIGHAVGLKHPFDGDPVLRVSEDKGTNTVMSYKVDGNYDRLGPYDIAAAQHIYGTPETEAASPIRWARGADGSLVTTGNHDANSISGLNIRDVVFAGAGNDVISVHGGDDDVAPGAGNDTVYGGAGTDAIWTAALRRPAWIAASGNGTGTVGLADGTDTFHQVETLRFVDGDVLFHAGGAAGQAYRLYAAALGRAPDPIGLGYWADAIGTGRTSLSGAARDFAGSAEFAARHGAPDDAGFVYLLYWNVLGRPADAAGASYWVNAMQNPAVGRAGVLLGFSESAENRLKTAGAFERGAWVANPEAVDVLRAYLAVLDRRPDAGGLADWTAAREAGLGQFGLVDQFVRSGEFQGRFGGLSNRDFVEQLYRTALDRPADAAGLDAWTNVLDAGIDSRSGVAFGFASSFELSVKLTPLVADGILLA